MSVSTQEVLAGIDERIGNGEVIYPPGDTPESLRSKFNEESHQEKVLRGGLPLAAHIPLTELSRLDPQEEDKLDLIMTRWGVAALLPDGEERQRTLNVVRQGCEELIIGSDSRFIRTRALRALTGLLTSRSPTPDDLIPI